MTLSSRIQYKLKRTYVDTLFFLNLERILITGKKVNKILMYHGIDLVEEKKFNSRFIGVNNFRRQILFLKRHTNIISLQDFFEKKFDPNKSNIAITFDDGFLNNYKYAVPILEELKVKATIYVTGLNLTEQNILWPDYIDIASYFTAAPIQIDTTIFNKNTNGKYHSSEENKTLNEIIKEKGNYEYKLAAFKEFEKHCPDFKKMEEISDYWKLMNDEQLKKVDNGGYVRIESHAFWHNNLANIPFSEATKELQDSKNYLENLLQREITELAYPDSSYSRELISAAESIGYKYQLAADGYRFDEDVNDHRIMDRDGLYPAISWCNQMVNLFS